MAKIPKPAHTGVVLKPDQGEVLERGSTIKIAPDGGSPHFGMATQQLKKGQKIRLHLHEYQDEVFFVHQGRGIAILGDEQNPIEAGSVVFIPQGVWHGFESLSDDLYLVWLISPPDFIDLFRQMYSPDPPEPERDADRMKASGYVAKSSQPDS